MIVVEIIAVQLEQDSDNSDMHAQSIVFSDVVMLSSV